MIRPLAILVLMMVIPPARSAPEPARSSAARPTIIGLDKPVFLGSMTVTATPLPSLSVP